LLPVVYTELRHLAAGLIANENRPISIQGTELVHAAYIRLVDTSSDQSWDSIHHFFSAAAEAMRRGMSHLLLKRLMVSLVKT
jgi:ECF sigma factor